ncbi:MAG: hypothetical protein J6H31_09405 [Butyrivibrio sp.]|nr:hypothetical protein [Butyrivibrio sp.]
MSIVKQFHPDTNTTYVYESTSYWDPEKGQSRAKRKLLGKEDPVTGELIPTAGKRGRKKGSTNKASSEAPIAENELEQKYQDCLSRTKEQELIIQKQRLENEALAKENKKLIAKLESIRKLLEA